MRQDGSEAREQRKAARYQLQIPVLFRWTSGEVHIEGGFTRDISSRAFFVMSTAAPPVRTRLDCRILMPARGNDTGNVMELRGRVARWSTPAEVRGLVIQADLYAHGKPLNVGIQ